MWLLYNTQHTFGELCHQTGAERLIENIFRENNTEMSNVTATWVIVFKVPALAR